MFFQVIYLICALVMLYFAIIFCYRNIQFAIWSFKKHRNTSHNQPKKIFSKWRNKE